MCQTDKPNAGTAAVIHTSDSIESSRTELEGPIVSTKELAAYLGVTRQTILRWRMVGYLPKPVRCDDVGTFWMKSTIDAWEICGSPWCDQEMARKAFAGRGEEEFNEFIAPETHSEGEKLPQVIAMLDDFESKLNALDFLVQGDVVDFDLAALGDRFAETRNELRAAKRRLVRRKRRRRT